MATIAPMLSYEDVATAGEWLVRAFGFRESTRLTDQAGEVGHLELMLGDGVVMLGRPGPAYQNPRHHRERCADSQRMYEVPYVIDGVNVEIEDVDAHMRRAADAGARIVRGPEDEPFGRLYVAEDPEGHRWMFVQPA